MTEEVVPRSDNALLFVVSKEMGPAKGFPMPYSISKLPDIALHHRNTACPITVSQPIEYTLSFYFMIEFDWVALSFFVFNIFANDAMLVKGCDISLMHANRK